MSDTKLTAEESYRQVLKSIVDACDRESLARAGGYLFRYVQEETVLRDCGQRGVCRTPPGCMRHWEERNCELVRENEVLRSNSDHLSSENASLASQVESMAMRIESLAETTSWRPTGKDTAFAPPFGTIRVCRACGCLVAGGPTACARCAFPGDES